MLIQTEHSTSICIELTVNMYVSEVVNHVFKDNMIILSPYRKELPSNIYKTPFNYHKSPYVLYALILETLI